MLLISFFLTFKFSWNSCSTLGIIRMNFYADQLYDLFQKRKIVFFFLFLFLLLNFDMCNFFRTDKKKHYIFDFFDLEM